MKKLLLILLCLPMIGFGQGWEKTFSISDYDFGKSVQQTSDGGYIIAGSTETYIWIIRTDNAGDTLWTNTFGGSNLSYKGNSVQQTNDGGYIILANKDPGGGNPNFYETILIKLDVQGDSIWGVTFTGGEGASIQQTNDGGYIILGPAQTGGTGWLIKTDVNGTQIWNRTLTFNNLDWWGMESVQQTNDGGYIICGAVGSFTGGGAFGGFLLKTDNNGIEEWSHHYTNSIFTGTNWGGVAEETSDGGYIMIGYYWDSSSEHNGWLAKTDNLGNLQWEKSFGDIFDDEFEDGQQTTDGGYIMTGYKSGSQSNYSGKAWLIKVDLNGNLQWEQEYAANNGPFGCYGKSVQQTSDGGYIITGYTLLNVPDPGNGISGIYDLYLIKTDGNGNVTSIFNIPIPNANRKLQKVVDVIGRETKGKKSEPLFYIYDDGTVEKKIVIE